MLDVHQLPMGYPYVAPIAQAELVLQPWLMYEVTLVLNAALSDWQNDVGEFIGFLVLGEFVGKVVGFLVLGELVVGEFVGESVGFDEGLAVVESVGFDEGLAVGESVGFDEGLTVREELVVGELVVGWLLAELVVGELVVGRPLGELVVGELVVRVEVGLELGTIVGMEVGALVGALVVTDTEMVTVTVAAPTVPFKLSTTERRLSFKRVPFLLNATVVSFMRFCMKLPSAIDSEISFFTEAFS